MSASIDKNSRILVVDDFESMRKLVIKNLNQMGYTHIVQAGNGQEAMRMLESNPSIRIVLTDWNMPVMNGLELLKAIRTHVKFGRLPVLMITAEVARQQVQEAAEAGVSDFLVKPFTVGGLQARFDKIISNLAHGKVVGAKGDGNLDHGDGSLHAALFGRKASQSPVRPATADSRPLPAQPTAGDQPLALVITEDLQAKMTRQATLLVVDDVPDNIDVLVGLLQDEYKVRASRSGEAALKMLLATVKAGQPLPDLILLDVMMPGMDGFEVCRRLKAAPELANIPVIFLSAADDAQNVVNGFELGAVDYVTKPANPTVLKTRVRTHLTRTKAFEELRKQHEVLSENLRLREEVEHITRHDLKNPIGGIMNFADLLLSDENLSADQRDMIATIGDSARTLLNMVNLSLDMLKIEQGTYELQPAPIDLVAILRRALQDKAAEIGAKKLRVTNTLRRPQAAGEADALGFKVLGDELLCHSLFGNLIKNAVEAAPDGTPLAIVYHADETGLGSVAITNGGTVPASIRDRFFDKFATAGKSGGTGIGTYSAKLLAEVQQGSIRMDTSDAQKQTTLTVSLPLAD
ncbi:MAG: response regulator [Rhizobium sp.]|nr:response regulator [Rhizobium sp.]